MSAFGDLRSEGRIPKVSPQRELCERRGFTIPKHLAVPLAPFTNYRCCLTNLDIANPTRLILCIQRRSLKEER
jgi:hypothetical protein